jgi:hypothetical protein
MAVDRTAVMMSPLRPRLSCQRESRHDRGRQTIDEVRRELTSYQPGNQAEVVEIPAYMARHVARSRQSHDVFKWPSLGRAAKGRHEMSHCGPRPADMAIHK